MSVASDVTKRWQNKHRGLGVNAATEAPLVLITDYMSNEIAGSGIYMQTSSENPLDK